MARSRNLKPGYFTNELLGSMDPRAQLLFAGLWCLADREGRLEDRPGRIKGQVFPYREADVDTLLDQLAAQGFIRRYTVNGVRCLEAVNFLRHQRPHPNEAPSQLPPPPDDAETREMVRSNPSSSLNPSSLNPSSQLPPQPPSSGGAGTVREFLDAWNSAWTHVPEFQPLTKLARHRVRWLQQRLRDPDWAACWRKALCQAARLPFFAGRNDLHWRMTVDWFLREGNVEKILEGQYDRLGSKDPPPERPEARAQRLAQVRAQAERDRQQAEADAAEVRRLLQARHSRNGPQGKRDA
jgi:hypothetical protein